MNKKSHSNNLHATLNKNNCLKHTCSIILSNCWEITQLSIIHTVVLIKWLTYASQLWWIYLRILECSQIPYENSLNAQILYLMRHTMKIQNLGIKTQVKEIHTLTATCISVTKACSMCSTGYVAKWWWMFEKIKHIWITSSTSSPTLAGFEWQCTSKPTDFVLITKTRKSIVLCT
jgi:hypothetical protein